MWRTEDHQFMARAMQIARRGWYTCDPNPRVGCVIVKDGTVLTEAGHIATGYEHAEIKALNACDPVGATLYTTLEPCSHQGRTPPCADALIKAKIKSVVVAMEDPNPQVSGAGIARLRAAGLEVRCGLLADIAARMNPGFIKRMTVGKPYVRCKMAMSLDARTALENGVSQWISTTSSRRDVHKLRAESSAILTSVATVIKDDPRLTARDLDFEFKQPLRVVIDRELVISTQANLFGQPDQILIYTDSDADPERGKVLEGLGADVIALPKDQANLAGILSHLADVYEINEVFVEAGARLSGALISQGLVDELIIYLAPKLLGNTANPLLVLPKIDTLDDAIPLKLADVRQLGDDLRLRYTLTGDPH